MVVEVLWTWGVLERVEWAFAPVMPPLRTVVPLSHPPVLLRDIAVRVKEIVWYD